MAHLVLVSQNPNERTSPLPDASWRTYTGIGDRLEDKGIVPGAIFIPPAVASAAETVTALLSAYPRADITPTTHSALEPRKFGAFIDTPEEAAGRFDRDTLDKVLNTIDFTPPGGESMGELRRRTLALHASAVVTSLQAGHDTIVLAEPENVRAYMHALSEEPDESLTKFSAAPYESIVYARPDTSRPIPHILQLPKPRKRSVVSESKDTE